MPTLHTTPSRPPSARTASSTIRAHVVFVGDVADDHRRAPTFGLDETRGLRGRVAVDVGARDRRAFTRREHRDRAPVADRRVGIVGRTRPAPTTSTRRPSTSRPRHRAHGGVYVFAPCPLSRKSRPRSSTWPTGSCGARSRPSTIRAGPARGSCTRCGSGTATTLVGWIATGPTPTKRSHLQHSPYVSCSYWTDSHDTCIAECRADWHFDDETRTTVWDKFVQRAAARRLRPRDRPRVGHADVGELRRAAPRAVAPARLPRHRARERRHIGDILVWQA